MGIYNDELVEIPPVINCDDSKDVLFLVDADGGVWFYKDITTIYYRRLNDVPNSQYPRKLDLRVKISKVLIVDITHAIFVTHDGGLYYFEIDNNIYQRDLTNFLAKYKVDTLGHHVTYCDNSNFIVLTAEGKVVNLKDNKVIYQGTSSDNVAVSVRYNTDVTILDQSGILRVYFVSENKLERVSHSNKILSICSSASSWQLFLKDDSGRLLLVRTVTGDSSSVFPVKNVSLVPLIPFSDGSCHREILDIKSFRIEGQHTMFIDSRGRTYYNYGSMGDYDITAETFNEAGRVLLGANIVKIAGDTL